MFVKLITVREFIHDLSLRSCQPKKIIIVIKMSYISSHNFYCIFYIRKLNQGFGKNYLLYLVLGVIFFINPERKKDLINLAFLITKHIRKRIYLRLHCASTVVKIYEKKLKRELSSLIMRS